MFATKPLIGQSVDWFAIRITNYLNLFRRLAAQQCLTVPANAEQTQSAHSGLRIVLISGLFDWVVQSVLTDNQINWLGQHFAGISHRRPALSDLRCI